MPRSRTFKIVHTFYLLVIAVLVTLLFVERQKQPDEPSTSAISEQLGDTQQTLRTRISDLSEQMDRRFAALEERLPPPHQQDQPERNIPPSRPQTAPQETPSSTQSDADTRSPGMMDSGEASALALAIENEFATRENQFALQPVNPQWAFPTADLIREQFSDHQYLRQLHLADIDCRSSICQVDIDVADPESINPARLLRALHGINDNQQGLSYQLHSRPLESTYRVLVVRAQPFEEAPQD